MSSIKQNNPWPDVQQRLQAARVSLYNALDREGNNHRREALYYIHHAIENALKAYIRANGVEYYGTHKLEDLVRQIQTIDAQAFLPHPDWLEKLSNFRRQILYFVSFPQPDSPSRGAMVEAQDLCRRMADQALALCAKKPADVHYEELPDVILNLRRPLGGMEDVNPQAFNVKRKIEEARSEGWKEGRIRGREEGRIEAKREALLNLASALCTAVQMADFERELDNTPWPNWPDPADVYYRFRHAK